MENQYRIGLVRMERMIKERMSSVEIDTVMPQDLINSKPVAAAVREFFGSSQLAQFMDQTNPLSEVTHKRRLSASGRAASPGKSRIRGPGCPPDPLRTNLPRGDAGRAEYRPDQFAGHVFTGQQVRIHRVSYRKVVESRVTDEVEYISATEEMRHTIAQANAKIDEKGSSRTRSSRPVAKASSSSARRMRST